MSALDLTRLRAFLLDLDGTIYLGTKAIPGAAEFIAYLRASGRSWLFYTNNPSHDAARYAAKLTRMGIDTTPDEVLTSGEATVRYLLHDTPYRRLFVLGVPSFEAELLRAGFVFDDTAPEAVLLSFDQTLTYAKLERATHLLRTGLPYIATNPDYTCPTERGSIPDCGAIACLLEAATGRLPKFIGKPNAEMVRMGLEKIDATTGSTAMVGDRLYTDMAMAHAAGIAGLLVLSGESSAADARTADPPPHGVFASVAELHAALAAADRA